MENTKFNSALYLAHNIQTLENKMLAGDYEFNKQLDRSISKIVSAFLDTIDNDINTFLRYLMDLNGKFPITLSDNNFCFNVAMFNCYDGGVFVGDTEIGFYSVEELEKSEAFKEFNKCPNCGGDGYDEELKCPVGSASDCCGGCYEKIECNCEEHKLFTDY